MLLFRPEDIASEATQWEDMEKEMMLNVTFHAMPIDQENVVEVGEIVSSRWQNLSLNTFQFSANQNMDVLKMLVTEIFQT